MRVSIAFVVHLLSVGIITTTLLAGFIIDRKIRKEPDVRLRLYLSGLSRSIGLWSPVAAILLLITGIANIHNRFLGSSTDWYSEGWLVAKIVLYVVIVLNGMLYGPRLMRSRVGVFKTMTGQTVPADADATLRSLNRQIFSFYIIQMVLFLLILYISVFGTAKHPGSI
jgi:hypothetical protein